MAKSNAKRAEKPNTTKASPHFIQALVVASYGRHFLARDVEGQIWQIYGKGKRREVAVGDEVMIQPSGDKQAWVEEIRERKNLVYRSDALKSKMFAANLDLVVLVLAVSPPYSPELLGRTLAACQSAGVPLHIVFNKIDLLEGHPKELEAVSDELASITLGEVPVHCVSVTEKPEDTVRELQPLFAGKRTLILGQSGMGKSTLINLLIPDALAATNEISLALNAGKHTTTHTQIHFGPVGMELIDSPGFQAFGLHHLNHDDLLRVFCDVAREGMRCRFANCQHLREPDCAVKLGLNNGELSPARFDLYLMLKRELQESENNYS